MQNKKYFSLFVVGLVAVSFMIAAPAFAQVPNGSNGGGHGFGRGGRMMQPGVFGTVSVINGNTITVSGRGAIGQTTVNPVTTPITWIVDATNATVTKNNAASTVANIAVGDTVMVQGTVSGTNVTAKTIRDGVPAQGQSAIQGNGQPVVAGSVTSVSGNTITITNKSNVTYTVDATNTKFVVTGVTSPTISNIVTGDNLVVQGTVNGNSVTASSVIDQKVKTNNGSINSAPKSNTGFMGGIMGGIGNFFKKIFGF